MKHPITKTILALGCVGTFASAAHAQTPITTFPTTYASGNFLLGFREVAASNSVVLDLGSIANFSLPEIYTVNLGSTLSTQYGSGWETNSNVYFSLAETDSSDKTSYVTSPQYLTGVNAGPATIWSRLTNPNAINLQGKINALGTEYTSAASGIEPNTDANAYQNYMPGGSTDAGHATSANIAFGFFNPTIEGNFDQGTASSTGVALDLIQLVPGSGAGSILGTFSLSPNGNTLTYTPTPLSVPEPSSYVALALGGILAVFGFRFNQARKSGGKQQQA